MTTLLESKARPYGSKKGAVISVVLHGGFIAAAIAASGAVALPEREKVEEHPILYVAAPPPPKVYVAPDPLPEVKKPPAATKTPRVAPPPPRAPTPPRPAAPTPRPSPQPQLAAPLVAPINVPTSLPAVDLKALPTVTDVPIPPPAPVQASSGGSSTRRASDGDVERGGTKGGLGSGSAASNKAYSENQVDRTVQVTRSVSPRYPDALKSVNVEGEVIVRYIVDARGRVEPGSIEILSTAHKLFSDAVRRALLDMRFRAAEANGQAVRQLVEQPFRFRLTQ